MLDNDLIDEFINKFYGYGNLNSDLWFVGMEEGGGNSFEEINTRLNIWSDRGKKTVEDLVEYHFDIGIGQFFDSNRSPIQRTWGKLILAKLSSIDKNTDREKVRNYQINSWARENGDTCLLELLPLPSPNLNIWNYNEYSSLPYLKNRELYKQKILNSRINRISKLIKEHDPKIVVFYGREYHNYWSNIVDDHSSWTNINFGQIIIKRNTKYFSISHPVSRGITNDYFVQLGKLFK